MKRIPTETINSTIAGKDFVPNRAEKIGLKGAKLEVEPTLDNDGFVTVLSNGKEVGKVLPNSGQLAGFALGWRRRGEVG